VARDAAVAGDADAAAERLSDRFHSVCEREPPEQTGTGEREVACHLYSQAPETDAVSGNVRR